MAHTTPGYHVIVSDHRGPRAIIGGLTLPQAITTMMDSAARVLTRKRRPLSIAVHHPDGRRVLAWEFLAQAPPPSPTA